MSEHEIAPALTPQEWAEFARVNYNPSELDSVFEGASATQKHYAAALALCGEPFGFSRGDVKALLEVAKVIQEEFGSSRATDPMAAQVTGIANRIAALLPPEE